MFLMIAYDYLTFINMMHYGARPAEEIGEEELAFREESALQSIDYASKFIEYDDKSNTQIALLYLSYTLRNLALFYRAMGRHEEAQQRFEESIDTRKKLYNYFRLNQLNKTITEQIKMEYYLSLKDNLKDVDPALQRRRIRELREYIEEVSEGAFNRKYLIADIERVLNEVTAGV
jgi:tetratricopeptide (TPR) repeat protein